jgi:hypothetical protein
VKGQGRIRAKLTHPSEQSNQTNPTQPKSTSLKGPARLPASAMNSKGKPDENATMHNETCRVSGNQIPAQTRNGVPLLDVDVSYTTSQETRLGLVGTRRDEAVRQLELEEKRLAGNV